jgi:hypothetical protein
LLKEENEKAKVLTVLTAVERLTIATLVFTPYSYFKRGRTTKQKLIFSDRTTVLLSAPK